MAKASAKADAAAEERRRLLQSAWWERRALAEVLLATDRVELTSLLHDIAVRGTRRGDRGRVAAIAGSIAETAPVLRASAIRRDALRLVECANATASRARAGTPNRAEGEMLVLGLRLVDGILASSARPAAPEPAPRAVN